MGLCPQTPIIGVGEPRLSHIPMVWHVGYPLLNLLHDLCGDTTLCS